ncbi:CPBP family intramembrane glutamic endopeptidase [Alkalihalobacillus trypoxylicola]|uniref:Peptidase n=1 Tax=Alkalihalobacillus trypoxylicola TaxID=519424 RepID=A0A161Q7S9_9BACI|nr:type II CAAX endopeptidase family protein [Alkalihalobacillus trypoxylicola]KYG33012.1 peptidase [Alkalihalobacillus trypoxylicola]GAF66687.1 putative peptidase [Bacillus sp. TS-2]
MNKRYWLVILTYILVAQIATLPIFRILLLFDIERVILPGLATMIAFIFAFIIILFLLRPDMKNRHDVAGRSTRIEASVWAVLGIFMAYGSQVVANIIEQTVLGIDPGSENTAGIISMILDFPLMALVVTIIGPILEEIVFRMIIFGALYKRFNFFIAAFVSSLIFAAVHTDFSHLLIYTAMGFVFAYLYVKTKRILVPIIAHVAINTMAVLINILFPDLIEDILEQSEQIQQVTQFIGGFL